MPAYNGAGLISTAIQSVFKQTFEDWELIVIDDGSKDNTREIVQQFGPSVCYIHQQNSGTSVARNHGIFEAKGEYVAFLDQDDCWEPNKLELQVPVLDANPDIALVYSDLNTFRDGKITSESYLKNRPQASGWVLDHLFKSMMILPSTVVARRRCLVAVGGFDPAIRYTEDLDLWLRMAARWQFAVVPQVLMHRQEGNHNFGRDSVNSSRNVLKCFDKAMCTMTLTPEQVRSAKRGASAHSWSIGWHSFKNGDMKQARNFFRRSISYNWNAPRSWAYFLATFLPLNRRVNSAAKS
jgi:glycosyltransferase involved in cell wall biosynthesis